MDFKDYFSHNSANYLQYRPSYPSALFEFITKHCENKDLAVDVGTGNGQAAKELGNRFKKVIGFDPSAAQLEVAFLHPNVEYKLGKAEHLDLQSNSVDLLTVAQAIHWFDFDLFFKEVSRVVKPNGVFAFWTYLKPVFEGEINHSFTDFYAAIQSFWPEDRKFVDDGYATISPPFQEIETPIFYIERSFSLDLLLNYFSTWSAVKNGEMKNGVDFIKTQFNLIETKWKDLGQEEYLAKSKVFLKLYRIC